MTPERLILAIAALLVGATLIGGSPRLARAGRERASAAADRSEALAGMREDLGATWHALGRGYEVFLVVWFVIAGGLLWLLAARAVGLF